MPEWTDKVGPQAGAEEDFASLFEQSLKSPKSGEVVTGRIVRIGRDTVTIDIGYKCEGEVSIHEFTTRDGALTVNEGAQVDVYFEGTDNETGAIHLSRQKALQFVVWRDIERAFESETGVEGVIVLDGRVPHSVLLELLTPHGVGTRISRAGV